MENCYIFRLNERNIDFRYMLYVEVFKKGILYYVCCSDDLNSMLD